MAFWKGLSSCLSKSLQIVSQLPNELLSFCFSLYEWFSSPRPSMGRSMLGGYIESSDRTLHPPWKLKSRIEGPSKRRFFMYLFVLLGVGPFFKLNITFFDKHKKCFWTLDAKPCRTIMKLFQKLILYSKHAKIDEKSDFGHVRTYSDWIR